MRYLFVASLCLLLASACSSNTSSENVLSDQEKQDGWILLFDGKTLDGWHLFNRGTVASAWSVDSGHLVCNPHAKNVKHGDLVSDRVFTNFDLQFD